MAAPSTKEIVEEFTQKITGRLDETKLGGPVRLDNTHTVVIIPLKDRDPIYLYATGGVGEKGVDHVIKQIALVPSLKGLVTSV